MGCSPSKSKLEAAVRKDVNKITPKKVFTDIKSEKAKRLEKLELLLQKEYDNRDNGTILCIEDYLRLDSVKIYNYSYDHWDCKILRRIVEHDEPDCSKVIIPDNYSNGCEEIISYDEVSALLDKIIKVPHIRQITRITAGDDDCLWKYEINIRYVKGISS